MSSKTHIILAWVSISLAISIMGCNDDSAGSGAGSASNAGNLSASTGNASSGGSGASSSSNTTGKPTNPITTQQPSQPDTPSPPKAITSFALDGFTGVISGNSIAVTVPSGLNGLIDNLVAEFVTTGASVTVGAVPQISGTTRNDFSTSVTYQVTATDQTVAYYQVAVLVAPFAVSLGIPTIGQAGTYNLTSTNDDPINTVTINFSNADTANDTYITYTPSSCVLASMASCTTRMNLAANTPIGSYVINTSDGLGHVVLKTFSVVFNGFNAPTAIALAPNGVSAFVLNLGDYDAITQCVVDNGTFSNCSDTGGPDDLQSDSDSYGIAFNPAGTLAFETLDATASVRSCAVVNGVLTNCQDSGGTGFNSPTGIALSPDGAFAFVTNPAVFGLHGNTVSQCSVRQAMLQNCTNNNYAGFSGPSGIALNPAGTLAVITNVTTNSLTQCNVSNGVLSGCRQYVPPGANPFSTPVGVAFNPAGTFVFITNSDTNNVVSCAVGGSALSNCVDSGGAGFNTPIGITIDSTDSFAYVVSQADHTIYVCNVSGGTLSGCADARG